MLTSLINLCQGLQFPCRCGFATLDVGDAVDHAVHHVILSLGDVDAEEDGVINVIQFYNS